MLHSFRHSACEIWHVSSRGLGTSQTALQAHRHAESLIETDGHKLGARNVFICFNVSIFIHLAPRGELISAT